MTAKRVGATKKAKLKAKKAKAPLVLTERPMLSEQPYSYEEGTSQSMCGTWMDCKTRARLSLLGYRGNKKSVPLEWGSMMHWLLEHVYKMTIAGDVANYKDAIAAFEPLLARYMKKWRKEVNQSSLAPQEMELLCAMADGVWPQYCRHWSKDFTKVKWMELEGVFDEMWVTGFEQHRLRGMRDGIFETKDGLWWLETKTKGQWNQDTLDRTLGMNFQNLFYILAGEITAERIGSKKKIQGVRYNIVRRPQIKPGKDGNLKAYVKRLHLDTQTRPDFYYNRMDISYPEVVRKEFRDDLKQILEEFRAWCEGGMKSWKQRFACEGRKFNCEFIDACNKRHMRGYRRDARLFTELEV